MARLYQFDGFFAVKGGLLRRGGHRRAQRGRKYADHAFGRYLDDMRRTALLGSAQGARYVGLSDGGWAAGHGVSSPAPALRRSADRW